LAFVTYNTEKTWSDKPSWVFVFPVVSYEQ